MSAILGPRTVFYQGQDGKPKPIVIRVEIGGRKTIDLPGGEQVHEHVGVIRLKCSWFDRTMTFSGADDLQVIYRCLWLGDVWLQKACKDAGVTLFAIVPDHPAEQPFDVFA